MWAGVKDTVRQFRDEKGNYYIALTRSTIKYF